MQTVDTAVDRELAKYRARLAKARLSYYGTFVSLLLTLSVLGSGLTFSSLLTLALMLPLPLYFTIQSLRLYRKTRLVPLVSDSYHLTSKFSLGKFLTQPNLSFRLSLALLFLVLFTTFARLRLPAQAGTPDPTLSYQPYAISRTP